jgi:nuclear transport factor 2 (NTF2) superfamily protein
MNTSPTAEERALLAGAYRDFNARQINAVLARMDANVDWPNGMEGDRVHGREEVRSYWTRQWGMIDPHVETFELVKDEAGRIAVRVHQVVKDLEGNLLLDTIVQHVYRIQDGLILRMDIE